MVPVLRKFKVLLERHDITQIICYDLVSPKIKLCVVQWKHLTWNWERREAGREGFLVEMVFVLSQPTEEGSKAVYAVKT